MTEDFNDGFAGKFASRMRQSNPEQFYAMVRMHLSFELELKTEENDTGEDKAKLKKWGGFLKKPKSTTNLHKATESKLLTKEGINKVTNLVNYLSQDDCIKTRGIFRVSGNVKTQAELKKKFFDETELNLEMYTFPDCANILKALLSDLPEPLLTEQEYPTLCQIAELINSDEKTKNLNEARILRCLQLVLLQLPPPNRIVLKQLMTLLHRVSQNEESNKMNCSNLAILFIPHLLLPRKISPEMLQKLQKELCNLIAFMIKKGSALFDIPLKLSTDIRAFLVEQDKQLLSPDKTLNESTADAAGTVHTVFSFVDRNLTAKATAAQDTEAALAQLYAHIQQMPESTKKRKLIKQFNKENGQGTPRQFKQNNSSSKSFGDSIKKRIFQKKLLSHKSKLVDVKLGCNFSRSSSEENMISNTLETSTSLLPKMFSKSEDELSDIESYEVTSQDNLVKAKHMSNSTGSLNTPSLSCYKKKGKVILKSFLNISEKSFSNSSSSASSDEKNPKKKRASSKTPPRLSRHQSEPPDMYSSYSSSHHENRSKDGEALVVRQASDSAIAAMAKTVVATPKDQPQSDTIGSSDCKSSTESAAFLLSPATKSKLRYLNAHSTPSNLLRKSLTTNDYALTPITDDDKSMSPITQSTSKMPKSMQETMMTPRSRKPVIMISASNLCGLPNLNNGSMQYDSTNSLQASNFDLVNKNNCISMVTSPNLSSDCIGRTSTALDNKENITRNPDTPDDYSYVTCIDDAYGSTIQKSTTISITNTFQQYYPSRSVLTASPVDLSFTSRTGDFEQSGSDLNVLTEEGTTPGSDTSGVASSSSNSANNSTEKVDEAISSPRKRCASLQRNDSKRSFKDESICEKLRANKILKHKQLSESALSPLHIKEPLPETSF